MVRISRVSFGSGLFHIYLIIWNIYYLPKNKMTVSKTLKYGTDYEQLVNFA